MSWSDRMMIMSYKRLSLEELLCLDSSHKKNLEFTQRGSFKNKDQALFHSWHSKHELTQAAASRLIDK